jgi:hypothetical protein
VIANDLSASAVEDIRRNIAFNGLAPKGLHSIPGTEGMTEDEIKPGKEFSKAQIEEAKLGKVRANEGDAWCVAVRGFRCFLFFRSVSRGECPPRPSCPRIYVG